MAKSPSVHLEEESSVTPVLIKAFGEFWSPDAVDWTTTSMWGSRRPNSKKNLVDVYEQRGVYVLYQDFIPVYVGKGHASSIGWRLKLHRESTRKGSRWDRFSWFGVREIVNDEVATTPGKASAASKELIATLEALLILSIHPPLNSRRERFPNAIQFYQSDVEKPPSAEQQISEQLATISSELTALRKSLKG